MLLPSTAILQDRCDKQGMAKETQCDTMLWWGDGRGDDGVSFFWVRAQKSWHYFGNENTVAPPRPNILDFEVVGLIFDEVAKRGKTT